MRKYILLSLRMNSLIVESTACFNAQIYITKLKHEFSNCREALFISVRIYITNIYRISVAQSEQVFPCSHL